MRSRETLTVAQVFFCRTGNFLPPRPFVVERDQIPKSKSK